MEVVLKSNKRPLKSKMEIVIDIMKMSCDHRGSNYKNRYPASEYQIL